MANSDPREADPFDAIRKLVESNRQIKLGQGVVGKTSHATIAILGVWALIIYRLSENLWLDAALLVGGLFATAIYFWWVSSTQKFAKNNPAIAILDGAQFLEHQKFEAQVKGGTLIEGSTSRVEPQEIASDGGGGAR